MSSSAVPASKRGAGRYPFGDQSWLPQSIYRWVTPRSKGAHELGLRFRAVQPVESTVDYRACSGVLELLGRKWYNRYRHEIPPRRHPRIGFLCCPTFVGRGLRCVHHRISWKLDWPIRRRRGNDGNDYAQRWRSDPASGDRICRFAYPQPLRPTERAAVMSDAGVMHRTVRHPSRESWRGCLHTRVRRPRTQRPRAPLPDAFAGAPPSASVVPSTSSN